MDEDTIKVASDGILQFKGKEYRCALGKSGVTKDKREGDNATPAGCFPIREVFYRKDKIGENHFQFRTTVISKNDAWCDDPASLDYNKHIEVDENAPEKLWRDDDVYDVVVVLGYNDSPPIPGKGSAIFMHVAREGYTGTAGCIALSLPNLLEVLHAASTGTRVCVE